MTEGVSGSFAINSVSSGWQQLAQFSFVCKPQPAIECMSACIFTSYSSQRACLCMYRWAAVADDEWPTQKAQRDVMLADFDFQNGFGDRCASLPLALIILAKYSTCLAFLMVRAMLQSAMSIHSVHWHQISANYGCCMDWESSSTAC